MFFVVWAVQSQLICMDIHPIHHIYIVFIQTSVNVSSPIFSLPLPYLVVTHLIGQHLLGVHEFRIVVGARTSAAEERIMIRSGQQQIVQVLSLLGTDVRQLNRDQNGLDIDH